MVSPLQKLKKYLFRELGPALHSFLGRAWPFTRGMFLRFVTLVFFPISVTTFWFRSRSFFSFRCVCGWDEVLTRPTILFWTWHWLGWTWMQSEIGSDPGQTPDRPPFFAYFYLILTHFYGRTQYSSTLSGPKVLSLHQRNQLRRSLQTSPLQRRRYHWALHQG